MDGPSSAIERLSPWAIALAIGTTLMVIIHVQLLRIGLPLLRELVWIPWKVMTQMRKLGYSGPAFSLFKNNNQEMRELMMKAPSEPLLTSSGMNHDIASRVLAPVHTWRKIYGDKFFFKHGSLVTMYTSDPDAIKEIFSKDFQEYGKGIANYPVAFDLLGAKSLGFLEHEEWKKLRQVVRPAFYLSKSKTMVVEMGSWIEPWLQRLECLVVDNGGALDIDMYDELDYLTKVLITRSAFGSSFEKGKEGFEQLEKLKELVVRRSQGWFSNRIWSSLPTALNKEINKVRGEALRCLQEIIRFRRQSIKPGSDESYGDDFLGMLLLDRDRRLAAESRPPGDRELEDPLLTDQCRLFFLAGAVTNHNAVSWCVALLGHYTDWQRRIRAEVQEAFRDALPDGEQLTKLKYLEMFVQETLRLYGSIATTQREVIGNNAILLGAPLPKHLVVMISMLDVHRDKKYWGDDALDFKPERFANGVLKACKNSFAFDPFGAGRRICVGEAFARTEVKVVLAMLLQRFSFRLSPSYRHEPKIEFVLRPKSGIQVVLERLHPKSEC